MKQQTGRIQIEFDLVNDDFQGFARQTMVAATLLRIAARISQGALAVTSTKPDRMAILDGNGNTIGACYYRTKKRQARKGEV